MSFSIAHLKYQNETMSNDLVGWRKADEIFGSFRASAIFLFRRSGQISSRPYTTKKPLKWWFSKGKSSISEGNLGCWNFIIWPEKISKRMIQFLWFLRMNISTKSMHSYIQYSNVKRWRVSDKDVLQNSRNALLMLQDSDQPPWMFFEIGHK